MRANGSHALIKSSLLHQRDHEGILILRHVSLATQRLGDTGDTIEKFWYCETDRNLTSCRNNLVVGLVENITSLV